MCVYIPSSYATCSTVGRISEQDIDITKQISELGFIRVNWKLSGRDVRI